MHLKYISSTRIFSSRFTKIFLLFCACAFIGSSIGKIVSHNTARQTAASAQSSNWGLSFQEEGKRPVGNATIEELAQYNAFFAEDTEEKKIYLTFDAGFENGNTPAILDALKKHQAPATFFVVGNFISENKDLIKRMETEGHIVGNHTMTHPDMSKISTKESFQKELSDVEKIYREITGKEMTKFYRPPQGIYSTQNLSMARELGYHTFFWSLAYVDWYQDNQPDPQEAIAKLTKRIHPGAIVLLHSTSSTNAQILDEIKKDGKIKIGVFSDKNPFGYVDENGDVQGYDIYFGKRLAKDLLGSEDDAEFTYVEAASRVEYLQSAKVDVILANFTVTDDRAEKVDFALPYMKVALGVVSPDDALIKDVKDLEGKKLIVVKGTTAETYFTDNYPDIELVKFDEYQEAYDALLDGRGDAFSTDNTEVLAWAQQNEGFSVGIESLGDIDTIAPAVQKGNTDLLNAINDEIKSLADEQFFHKDFEETLKPVYGDNINPDDLVVEGGVVDSEEKAEDADAAATEDSDAASDDTKDAETTEEPEETEAADAE